MISVRDSPPNRFVQCAIARILACARRDGRVGTSQSRQEEPLFAGLRITLALAVTAGIAYVVLFGGSCKLPPDVVGVLSLPPFLLAWWFALRGHLPQSRSRIYAVGTGGIVGACAGWWWCSQVFDYVNIERLVAYAGLGFGVGASIGMLYAVARQLVRRAAQPTA